MSIVFASFVPYSINSYLLFINFHYRGAFILIVSTLNVTCLIWVNSYIQLIDWIIKFNELIKNSPCCWNQLEEFLQQGRSHLLKLVQIQQIFRLWIRFGLLRLLYCWRYCLFCVKCFMYTNINVEKIVLNKTFVI